MTGQPDRRVRRWTLADVDTYGRLSAQQQHDLGSRPPAAKPVRRAGHIGSVEVTQIALAEAAVLVAAAVATRGPIPGGIGVVVAAAIVVAAFARRRKRWWIEDALMAWRLQRRRVAKLDAAAPPALAALRSLAPGLALRDVTMSDGARVGVARDDAGWFAAVALTPSARVDGEAAPVPVDTLAGVLADSGRPGTVLQLLTHTVPAPGRDLHVTAPAAASYRQLTGPYGPIPLPAHRESTVVARVDARMLAEELLNAGADADVDAASALVAGLGRRVARSLRRAGVACRALDADELLRALVRSCDVEAGDQPVSGREEWTEWHSAALAHRTFWLQTWPPADQVGSLLDWAAGLPADQTNVSLLLAPAGTDDLSARVLIRVAAPLDALAEISRQLTEGAARFGAQVFALDGEHGQGVYATAPTGGGAG
jgi:ESX secretion system protein EccE